MNNQVTQRRTDFTGKHSLQSGSDGFTGLARGDPNTDVI